MSLGVSTRTLLRNVWYLSSTGFKQGYVFINASRVEDAGEGDPPPEYELAELLYDFEGEAVVHHGYSVIADIVEYVFRGLDQPDLSIFTREELRKLASVGLVSSYMSGVTLPIAVTKYPEIIVDIARENMMRIGLVVERGTIPRSPYILPLEVDNGKVYYEDKVIGEYKWFSCPPTRVDSKCIVVDARGYGNALTAIEEVFMNMQSYEESIRILTNIYRVVGIDSGYVEKGATSDLVVHDTKNPLKAIPLTSSLNLYKLIARSQQPDIVFIGGDVFFEKGENLAIPLVKINEILRKKLKHSPPS